jgi:hypothetical protein
MMHVMRCTPLDVVREGAARFDLGLHKSLRRIVVGQGGGFGPLQDDIASLPLSMGGLGITRAEDIRPFAFWASFHQSLDVQDNILNGREFPFLPAVSEARAGFAQTIPAFDVNVLNTAALSRKGLQGKLGEFASKVRRDVLLARPAIPRLHEVILSAGLPHACQWLQALPLQRLGQGMSAIDFVCRLKYHLLIPLYTEGAVCPCCSQPMDCWGDHAIQCRYGRAVATTHRHNMVRDILFRIARELGVRVEREPHFPVRVPGAEGRRPDIVLRDWDEGRDLFVDVVGSSPLAVSHREAFVPGGSLTKAVTRKGVSYRDVLAAQPPSVLFQAFSFETLGGLHPEALALVGRLQGVLNLASCTHDDVVWHSVVRRVSFAIAKAVACSTARRYP